MATNDLYSSLWSQSFQSLVPWNSARIGFSTFNLGKQILLMGSGKNGELESFLLQLDTKKWIKLTVGGEKLEKCSNFSTVFNPTSKEIYILGTKATDVQFPIYVLTIANSSYVIKKVKVNGTSPSPRYAHSATFLPSKNMILIFGGISGNQVFDELYLFDIKKCSWIKPNTSGTPPSPRHSHSGILLGNYVYVTGGINPSTNQLFADTFIFDIEMNTWHLLASASLPSPRYNHAVCIAPFRESEKIFLIGGKSYSGVCQDSVYILQGSSISEMTWYPCPLPPNSPSSIEGHSILLIDSNIYIFGGEPTTNNNSDIFVLTREKLIVDRSQSLTWNKAVKPLGLTKKTSSQTCLQAETKKVQLLKIIASVGTISSVVNMKYDPYDTVEGLMEKILRRFPTDSVGEKFGIYLPLEKDVLLEETKQLCEYEKSITEAEWTLELKKKSAVRLKASSNVQISSLAELAVPSSNSFLNAIKAGNEKEVINILKQTEAKDLIKSVDDSLQTALHIVSSSGTIEVLNLLLKHKPDLNVKDKYNWTPLHCAANAGNIKICLLLLKEGADPSILTDDKTSVLHYIAKAPWDANHSPKLISSILKRVDINCLTSQQETALHKACLVGNIEGVKFLIKNKADVNIINKYGETCLHYACRAGWKEIAKLLLENGADYTIVGENGTAKIIAKVSGFPDIEDLIPSTTQGLQEFNKEASNRTNRASLSRGKDLVLQIQMEYEQEVKLRKKAEETLAIVKGTLKIEVEQRSKLSLELQETAKKYEQEKLKYENLKKLTENQVKEIHAKEKLQQAKEKLEDEIQQLTMQCKLEESLRLKVEKKMDETLAELNNVTLQFLKFQNQLKDESEESKLETTDSVTKELRYRLGLIQCRNWDGSPKIGEDSIEWHIKRLNDVGTSLISEDELNFIDSHRRFIQKLVVQSFSNNGFPIKKSIIVLNDLILITSEEIEKKSLLFSLIPIDLCSISSLADSPDGFVKNGLTISRKDSRFSFSFYTSTPAQKEALMKDVQACISALPPINEESKKQYDQEFQKQIQETSEEQKGKISNKFKKFIPKPYNYPLMKKDTLSTYIKSLESNDSKLNQINLAKSNLKVKGVQSLSLALQENTSNSLTHLILSGNTIEDKGAISLANSIRDDSRLNVLILDNNSIQQAGALAIAELLKRISNLRELNMAENAIGDEGAKLFGDALHFNKSLKILNLSNNLIDDQGLMHLAESIRTGIFLSELYLDNNPFSTKGESFIATALKDAISAITEITLKSVVYKNDIDVSLKRNKERIQRAEKALTQDILDNKSASLQVDLGFYKIDLKLASSFNFKNLTSLYLDNCNLTQIPSCFCINSLTSLVLMNNSISVLPKELFHLHSLTLLDLSYNKISYLPEDDLSKLINLKSLILAFNSIFVIPGTIGKLLDLTQLMLQGNKLSHLPFQIFSLPSLQELAIDFNPIPPVLQKIYQAWVNVSTELNLSELNLNDVPVEIGQCLSLTSLNLRHNKLKSLPPHIGNLLKLRILDIRDNQIEDLPCQIANLNQLEKIEASGNRKLLIPDDLPQLKSSLMLRKGESRPFRRIKLMLVGKENVGKTSIRQCLQSRSLKKLIKLKKEQGPNVSTDGIDMELWEPSEEERGTVPLTFSIWDFAGQEVYYVTHQFFLSSLSVYLIVFNMKESFEEETTKIDYWLQSIRSRTQNAPVILVGTHADEVSKAYMEEIQEYITQKYLRLFNNVKHFIGVSCKTRQNISVLQESLLKIAQAEESINESYSHAYHQLADLVLTQREFHFPPVISMVEFKYWAEACGLISVPEIQSALKLLADLGLISYFSHAKSQLDKFIILDPQWLTKVMSTLITSKPNFVKNGILVKEMLRQIWKPPEFPESLHEGLLSLLKAFEIVFPLPKDSEEKIIVPSLVNFNEKPSDLEVLTFPNCTKRIYQFDFLPFGFFSRLIIRMLYFLNLSAFWKNGIFLISKSASPTKVQLDFVEKDNLCLEISIMGRNVTKYLRLLVENIDLLLRGWYKVNYTVFIPCPCDRCCKYLPPNKRTVFSIQECEQIASQDRTEIMCKSMDIPSELPVDLRGELPVKLSVIAPDLILLDLVNYKLKFEDFQLQTSLGKGGFGEVWKAVHKNGTIVALKILNETSLAEQTAIAIFQEFRKEVWLTSNLIHPTIVKLIGCCIKPCCLAMEFIPNGNLSDFLLDAKKEIPWLLRYRISLNIIDALRFLHHSVPKLVHRDLKSPNILMVSFQFQDEVVCKVSDFGDSTMLITKALGREKIANPIWCAPEIIKGEEYTEKADIFSMGILMVELASRIIPYSDYEISNTKFLSVFEDAIISGLRPSIPETTPENYAKLIQICWSDDPDQRPSAESLYESIEQMFKEANLLLSMKNKKESSSTSANTNSNTKNPQSPGVSQNINLQPFRPLVEKPAFSRAFSSQIYFSNNTNTKTGEGVIQSSNRNSLQFYFSKQSSGLRQRGTPLQPPKLQSSSSSSQLSNSNNPSKQQ